MRRGSGQSPLDPETVATCLRVIKDAQAQLNVSKTDAMALARLTGWLGAFCAPSPGRNSTAVEALDDPRQELTMFLAAQNAFHREPSGSDLGTPHGGSSSKANSLRLSRPSLLLDEHNDQLRASSGSFTSPSPQLAIQLEQIVDWNGFDVFAVARLSNGRPLQNVTWALMLHFGLVEDLELPPDKLRNFLKALEGEYNSNPYHNSTHAADVTQNVGVLLAADGLHERLSRLEVLSMLLAACVHDVRHPGFGNAYMVNQLTDAAVTWNDISVNENMHASTAFRLLARPANAFLGGLPPDEFRFVRRTVIGIVLATDMASHADLVADFTANVALLGEDLSQWPVDKRLLALSMAVHCADLGNPGKALRLSLNWSARVTKEFFGQGDAERLAGLPISRGCDRRDADVGASQLAFMEAVVAPSFKALAAFAPSTAALALENVEKAQAHWKSGAVQWRDWLSPAFEDFEPRP